MKKLMWMLLVLLFASCGKKACDVVEFEVYTLEDILYINTETYTITSESGLNDRQFKCGAELAEYLSHTTAMHNQL